ncbi:hypothetical protein Tco_1148692 [Tanacetum coccineum]
MSNRHQKLASPEKTASGKDFSNPLMADSLPKTIWFSTHHASQLTTTINRLERYIQTGINSLKEPEGVEMQEGLIHDHTVRLRELSPSLFERYDRDIGELFTSDMQMENQELRLQITEERHARLYLAKIIDSIRRGQEPRGDV